MKLSEIHIRERGLFLLCDFRVDFRVDFCNNFVNLPNNFVILKIALNPHK